MKWFADFNSRNFTENYQNQTLEKKYVIFYSNNKRLTGTIVNCVCQYLFNLKFACNFNNCPLNLHKFLIESYISVSS